MWRRHERHCGRSPSVRPGAAQTPIANARSFARRPTGSQAATSRGAPATTPAIGATPTPVASGLAQSIPSQHVRVLVQSGREHQRRPAALVAGVDVGAGVERRLYAFRRPVACLISVKQ